MTPPPADSSGPGDRSQDQSPQDVGAAKAARGSKLPVGPLAVLAMTAVALLGAFLIAWLFVEANTDDPADARDVLEVEGEDQSLDRQGAPKIGDPIPELQIEYLGPDAPEATGNLSDFAGTPMIINFWSSTCAPCLAEMPDLEQVNQETGDAVQFLGIDVTDTAEAGQKMVERTGVTYPNVRDPRAEIMGALGGTALPRTMLVGADGVVLATHNGAITAEDLSDLIEESGMLDT